MEMMQLCRLVYIRDGISLDNLSLCLSIRMHHFLEIIHGSETWPMKKENKLTLQWAELRMIRWMCGIKVTDGFSDSNLRERLETNYIIAVIH